MSQNPTNPESDEPTAAEAQGSVPGSIAAPEQQTPAVPANAAADESTVGTGTSMALGCIAGTVVLIIFGLLFLFISTLV